MSENVSDLTIEFIDTDGTKTVQELDKVILSTGAWATILYRYQDLDRKTNQFGPDRYSLRRYQKRNGVYQQRSKFNISSAAQAKKIIKTLQSWVPDNVDE